MGSKNHPGTFDAYDLAEGDEPMFTLLGRDADAPGLVEQWAKIREDKGEDPAKVREARECADAMRLWYARRRTLANANVEALALLEQAVLADGGPEKQWFLVQLTEVLGGKVPDGVDLGLAP